MPFRKPMLAATIRSVAALRFPLVGSPKLDGIRCLMQGGRALSRTGLPIPNRAACAFLEALPTLEGCDGELMVHGLTFNEVSSVFMTGQAALPPAWYYGLFDVLPERAGEPYTSRLERLKALHAALPAEIRERVVLIPQLEITTLAELETFENSCLGMGFEGVMFRRANAPYKHGRVTVAEGYLAKLKRFVDGEAEIVGFKPLVRDTGEVCELLGALVVRDLKTGVQFDVGTGYSQADIDDFWKRRAQLMGARVKYKHFPRGSKSRKPRHASFLGLRAREDM